MKDVFSNEMIYIIIAAFAAYYLYLAVKTQKKVEVTAKLPGRFIGIGIVFSIAAVFLGVNYGFTLDLLYTCLALCGALGIYAFVKSGLGEDGIYANGKLIKREDVRFFDYETSYKDYLRVRFNSFSRDCVLYFKKEQQEEVEDYLRGLKIYKK